MMSTKITTVLILAILLVFPTALALEDGLQTDCLYYFYGKECEDCEVASASLLALQIKYPNLRIEKHEVYRNFKNFEMMKAYFEAYGIEEDSRSIPVLFSKGSYLIGSKAITSLVEEGIKNNDDPSCPELSAGKTAVGILGQGQPPNVLKTLTFSLVTGQALQNMFAPGMLALLLILLAILSATKTEEEIVKTSALYILGVFLAYLLFGVGLWPFFYDSQLHYFFYKIVGFAALLFGLAGVQSFFTAWELVMPSSIRVQVKEVLRYALSPLGVFVLGLVGGMFTLAGVSQSFYLLRDLFIGNFMRGMVLPLMIYYIAVAMLIFIGLAAAFHLLRSMMEHAVETQEASSDAKRERWRKHYQRVLTFCVRSTLFVLGIVLVFV
ncbi:MAG: hypothetical protein Q8R47_03145 [Nanoarchaeota archaeon]|nr:hypothetical protein [Nanoarchaeota archaeon]